MSNPFLANFMRQQAIIQSAAPQEEAPAKRDKKGRKRSKHGTADGKAPFGEEDAMTRICREKPPRKEVLQYFRDRIAQLVAEDMD